MNASEVSAISLVLQAARELRLVSQFLCVAICSLANCFFPNVCAKVVLQIKCSWVKNLLGFAYDVFEKLVIFFSNICE